MSVASTIPALERANAAYKAAQSAIMPVAKRGMFAMVERQQRRHRERGSPDGAKLDAEASRRGRLTGWAAAFRISWDSSASCTARVLTIHRSPGRRHLHASRQGTGPDAGRVRRV